MVHRRNQQHQRNKRQQRQQRQRRKVSCYMVRRTHCLCCRMWICLILSASCYFIGIWVLQIDNAAMVSLMFTMDFYNNKKMGFYGQHYGPAEGVEERGRMRREQHHAKILPGTNIYGHSPDEHEPLQRPRNRRHVNFLDRWKESHPPTGDKNAIIHTEHDGSYQVDRTGMLQRIPGSSLASHTATEKKKEEQRGYAPSGGSLPKPRSILVQSSTRLLTTFGQWSQVDQFTCLRHANASSSFSSNQTSGDSHHKEAPYLEWQTRAPYLIILGAMKGGTQALTSYLWQHERFVKKDKGMEIHFFGNLDYQQSPMGIPILENQQAYANRFQKSHRNLFVSDKKSRSLAKPNGLAVDSTPYYLMGSDQIPQAICCVTPWAKLIAILRHPVERVESHYRYLHNSRWQNQKAMVDWDAWISYDLHLLRETGVVQDWTRVNFEEYSGSVAEFEAWKRYLHHEENCQQIVGRGLYAIQLEHYFKVLKACRRIREGVFADVGSSPSSASPSLMVVQSEEFRRDTNRVYNRILQFLDLPSHNLTDIRAKHKTEKRHGIPMPSHIRKELQSFYRPYNERLYKLLNWSSPSLVWADA